MYNDFYNKYSSIITSDRTYIAQEAPISSGINSGKLNALGMYFYANLGSYSDYLRIKTYHPIKLKSFHKKKSYNKKDTINVIESIIDIFENHGFSVKVLVSRTKRNLTITDGEADAFMYAVKTYLDMYNNDISSEIIKNFPRFSVIQSIEEKIKEK